MPRLAAPGNLAFLADSAQVNTFEAPASRHEIRCSRNGIILTTRRGSPPGNPTANSGIRQRANVVFVDGHLGLEQMVPGSLDPRLPAQCIGWLRPEILTPGN